MSNDVRVTVVDFDLFSDIDFIPPATFYIRNASGDYVFVHTRSRDKAQAWIDENYGEGRYKVNASKIQKGSGKLTCTGTQTRRGQRK